MAVPAPCRHGENMSLTESTYVKLVKVQLPLYEQCFLRFPQMKESYTGHQISKSRTK